MSATPWFKFYPGDYLADTRRLSQAQHGAYMLIMLDYYSTGEPPPDDDVDLARISQCASISDWKAIRPAIAKYFDIRDRLWRHARIEAELAARSNEHRKKQEGANKTNKIRWGASETDTKSDTGSESHNESLKGRNTRSQKSEVRSQIPEPINPKKQAHTDAAVRLLAELGVDQQLIKDWTAVRKAKRAGPITETVIKAMEREAGKAGIPVSEAIKICAERGWQGFKAAWMTDSPQARQQQPSQSLQAARNLDELSRKIRENAD